RVVDRAFVERQATQLGLIADRFRAAHASGLTAAEALGSHDDWSIPVEALGGAVERAFRALDAQREARA
ncbi:MAG: hypothetical protein ACRDT9_14500, partial [Agromyces sp.]